MIKESFWSNQSYKEIHGEFGGGACESFSFMEVSYEYVMVARLKEIYRANIIALSIFFAGGTQAPIFDTAYHKRSP